MLCCVDPPEQSKGHVVMSPDLQAALGAIERGAEERLEMLRDRKRQLETSDMKPQLVGHMEVDEEGELLKIEAEPEEPDEGTENGGAVKRWVTQSVASLRDCKTEEEHREAGATVVCVGGEEVYCKCQFRHTTGSNGNDNGNSCSKFTRSRRNGTGSGYFDHGR